MRKLPPALKAHFDHECWQYPLKEPFSNEGNPTAKLILALLTCEGITELGGDNRGPLVELFQSVVGTAQREAWCLAFLQAGIAYIEALTGAKSRLPATEHCLTLWRDAPADLKSAIPSPGCIVIWQYRDTANGHAGLVPSFTSQFLRTIEGNTSPVGFEREGDGVYRKTRSRYGSETMKIVGFLKVFD